MAGTEEIQDVEFPIRSAMQRRRQRLDIDRLASRSVRMAESSKMH
jgi:hypothetical protein